MKIFCFFTIMVILASCSGKKEKSDAYGTFEATEITVSAETNGRILYTGAEEGVEMKQGQTALIIDTLDLVLKKGQVEAQKDAASTKLNNISAQIDVQKQQKQNLEIDKGRIENMLKEKAATQKQYDDIMGAINLIDKQMTSTETQKMSVVAELKAYDAQLAQIKENIRKSYVKNPVMGTVLAKYAEVGEIAFTGKPLYKVANLNTMYLRVYISGAQLAQVKTGQAVQVLIDDESPGAKPLEGVISWISSSSEFTPKIIQTKEERVNLVYAMKIRVENDGRLKIGMPGEILFK